jgi:hypothetical protein
MIFSENRYAPRIAFPDASGAGLFGIMLYARAAAALKLAVSSPFGRSSASGRPSTM